MENGNHIETRQPHASRNNNGAAERTTPQITMPHQMVEQGMGKAAKMIHHQKITAILEQLHNADLMTTIFHFYSTNKNTPEQPFPPLQGKSKLPQDPAGLRQYCPGQPAPENQATYRSESSLDI